MKITVMTADEQILTLDVDPHESVLIKDPSFLFLSSSFSFHITVSHSLSLLGRWRTSKHCSRLRWVFLFFTTHHFFTLKNHFLFLFWKELTLFQFSFLWMLARVFGKHRFSLKLWLLGFSLFDNPETRPMWESWSIHVFFLNNWWCWILFDF